VVLYHGSKFTVMRAKKRADRIVIGDFPVSYARQAERGSAKTLWPINLKGQIQ